MSKYKILTFEGKDYYVVPVEDIKPEVSKPISKKVAVVVGHTASAKGSYSPFIKKYEFDFFANLVKDLDPKMYHVFHHNSSIDSYTQRQVDMANKTFGYGLVVEMHFDSFERESAHGCHAIYYTTNSLTKSLAKDFGTANEEINGIKARDSVACSSRNQRGGGFIFEQRAPALLLEWGFGSNKEDSENMMSPNFDIVTVLNSIHPVNWY